MKLAISDAEFNQFYALANSKAKKISISRDLMMRFAITHSRLQKAVADAGIKIEEPSGEELEQVQQAQRRKAQEG